MALNHLICPHCGRPIVLEGSQVLQPRWPCPYCGRQLFLMQKAGEISLHGIISEALPESAAADGADEPDDMAAIASADAEEPIAKPVISTAESSLSDKQDEYEDLVRSVAEAARQRHLPRFNSLHRQALAINPEDGRIYAWRAVLTEQADGFTRSCWSSPNWLVRTPKQRSQLLKQHFYGLNTALQYIENDQERQDLISTTARQIARQISEYFTEVAELRLAEKKRVKPFSGRYQRRDLTAAPALHQALDRLSEIVEPYYGQELRQMILSELEEKNPRLLQLLAEKPN